MSTHTIKANALSAVRVQALHQRGAHIELGLQLSDWQRDEAVVELLGTMTAEQILSLLAAEFPSLKEPA